MIPKAIVFDLGKVLLDFDYGRAVDRIEQRCRLPAAELHTLINQSPLLHRYESNLLSTAEFFAEIQTGCGFEGDLQAFRQVFADIFTPIDPMVKMHEDLRALGTPTYIFSNTNEIAIEHIRTRFPFFRNFDGYILSYEHNAMKPDHRLYEVVENETECSGAELFYIDDRAENIRAAQQRGWQAVLHEHPENTRSAVIRAGLLPGEL